jgi:Zn-finger nucleic acid-binding protein
MKTHNLEQLGVCRQGASFRLQKLQREQQEATHLERRFLKVLHWMHCPKCGHELITERFDSAEIDICPSCRGVWLDLQQIQGIVSTDHGSLRSFLRLLVALNTPKQSNEGQL